MFKKGDWLLCRSYANGGTLGRLAQDWGGEVGLPFSEAFFVRKFSVEDSVGGTLATLSLQKPKEAEVFGGAPAVLNEPVFAILVSDEHAQSIKKFANAKK